MEIAIEKLAVICFFLFGLSHIVQPRSWAEFFIRLREKGTTGSFINGWIHFPLGALIVAFHNVWHGIPAVLTVLGYAWVIKGLYLFRVPTTRAEDDAASERGTRLVLCRCRHRPRRARRPAFVFVDKPGRTALKSRREKYAEKNSAFNNRGPTLCH
jgi:hypothetical protein